MNLIFDFDGTINNSMRTYRPAFEKAYKCLVDDGLAQPRRFSDSELSYWLGFTGAEMWAKFRPDLSVEERDKYRRIIGLETERLIRLGRAALFDGAREALDKLKADGHTLIFLSNCRSAYMELHSSALGLDRYFDFFYCAGDFDNIPKFEIFRKFKDEHSGGYIVIGDRFHDMETAVKNGLKSIGCAYGYGCLDELRDADIIVNDVSEIPAAVKTLCR